MVPFDEVLLCIAHQTRELFTRNSCRSACIRDFVCNFSFKVLRNTSEANRQKNKAKKEMFHG